MLSNHLQFILIRRLGTEALPNRKRDDIEIGSRSTSTRNTVEASCRETLPCIFQDRFLDFDALETRKEPEHREEMLAFFSCEKY